MYSVFSHCLDLALQIILQYILSRVVTVPKKWTKNPAGWQCFLRLHDIKKISQLNTCIPFNYEIPKRRSCSFPSIPISTSIMAATAVVIYMDETTRLHDVIRY